MMSLSVRESRSGPYRLRLSRRLLLHLRRRHHHHRRGKGRLAIALCGAVRWLKASTTRSLLAWRVTPPSQLYGLRGRTSCRT